MRDRLFAAAGAAVVGLTLLIYGGDGPLGKTAAAIAIDLSPMTQLATAYQEEEVVVRRSMNLVLPTTNDGLLREDHAQFFSALAAIPGLRPQGWQGGQYGIVRNQARTPAGRTFTRLHQGIDIRPLYRDRNGEPLDTVRVIDDGVVAYAHRNPRGSNYGMYVVVEHDWDGSPVYTLSAHLNTVQVQRGQALARGQAIGRLGYTGAGINKETAHLHLEVAMMLNRHYQRWHAAFFRGPNPHGLFMGRNLRGVDPAALYLALEAEPGLTFAEFVQRQPVAYRLALPGNRPLDILERYPWLGVDGVTNEATGSPGSWLIGFNREGVPVEIVRQEARVSGPQVAYVSDDVRRRYLSTAGILTRTGDTFSLTRDGRAYAALLATTASGAPTWF